MAWDTFSKCRFPKDDPSIMKKKGDMKMVGREADSMINQVRGICLAFAGCCLLASGNLTQVILSKSTLVEAYGLN
jgi:hypothetical protein